MDSIGFPGFHGFHGFCQDRKDSRDPKDSGDSRDSKDSISYRTNYQITVTAFFCCVKLLDFLNYHIKYISYFIVQGSTNAVT